MSQEIVVEPRANGTWSGNGQATEPFTHFMQ